MSHNSFGHLFRFTTWGESHGPSIGCVVDGTPPRIELKEEDIQFWLDRRRPGQSKFTSPRQELDQVRILSGVIEEDGKQLTTGTPISLVIENQDQRSKDYSDIKDKFRPGHADFTYQSKYGIRDVRGGGRQSARETAMRVAAGAIARKVLPNIKIEGALIQLGKHKINKENWDSSFISQNPFWSPDSSTVSIWENYIEELINDGDSCGAIIEVRVKNVPVGLGAPIYGKLDSDISNAIMSINAVKGVEIGNGFAAAAIRGSENSDEMFIDDKSPSFKSNNSGGILGGISSGQDIVVRFAIKPTSSIRSNQKTIDKDGNETEISTKGRHDPCVGIRAVPVGEAMVACVIADHFLRNRAQNG
jgi:chorismate synthase